MLSLAAERDLLESGGLPSPCQTGLAVVRMGDDFTAMNEEDL